VIFLIRCGRNPVIYDDPPPLQLSISFFNSIPHFSTFRFSPWSKKILQISLANLGKNSSRGQESLFNTRYLNGNILSFWYWNQAIQKPKFIYVSRTTTLMQDSKWDKFILNNRIATKLRWKPSRERILCFHARFQKEISWASDIEIKKFKSSNSSMCPRLQLWWRIRSEIKSFWITESGRNLVGQKGSPGLI